MNIEESTSKSKTSTDKDKIRRFLRERDLKKHLKGKSSVGEEETDNSNTESEEGKKSKMNSDLDKDSQLRHAISLLSGFDIIVNGLSKKNKLINSTDLTLEKINR